MKSLELRLAALAAIIVALHWCGAVTVTADDHAANYRVLERFCGECHAADVAEGGFDLTKLRNQSDVWVNRNIAKRVIAQVDSGSMPPDDPRLTDKQSNAITGWLLSTLNDADWEALREPVELVPARMTRQQYTNTLRDLLGVDVDVSDLLPEDSVGANGFNNDRASLAMTETQLLQYLDAAERAVTTLMHLSPDQAAIQVEAEDARHVTIKGVKNVTTLADGTAGFEYHHHRGIKYQQVSKTIDFPSTGTYRIEIRAKVTGKGKKGGVWIALDNVDDRRAAVVLVDSQPFATYSVQLFATAGHHEVIWGSDFNVVPWLPPVPAVPQRKLPSNRDAVVDQFYRELQVEPVRWSEIADLAGFQEPEDKAAALDIVEELNRLLLDESIRVYELFRLYEEHQFLPVNQPKGFRGTADADQKALGKMIGVSQEALRDLWLSHEPQQHTDNERQSEALVNRWHAVNKDRQRHVGNVFLDWFRVTGPVAADTRTTNSILSGLDHGLENLSPAEGALRMRATLQRLLPTVYRRPTAEKDVQRLLALYRRERDSGATHRTGCHRTLVAVLMSPHFLYVGNEAPRKGAPALPGQEKGVPAAADSNAAAHEVPLSSHQLAARLSYWLWMTTPNAGLVEKVQQLDREDSIALDEVIDSMLTDERSMRFCRDFTSQWLGLGALGKEKIPDSELFREFSWQLADEMRDEVALRFRDSFLSERNLLDLLDGSQTFLNERLARLYGIDDVQGVELRPYSFPNRGRGGLLGTAAVLTATSLPARTSPVQRGKFVVETLLGEDLPPPPADAGSLSEDAGQSVSTTLREQLAAHRDRPACFGCHQRIDPIGFALERLDFVGRQRERSVAGPIDNVGVLASGQRIVGLEQLNTYLRKRRGEAFVENIVRRLLTYSLGRTLDHRDEADVQLIFQAVRENGNSATTLIREIARSRAFQLQKR